jgi:hypothetical protein
VPHLSRSRRVLAAAVAAGATVLTACSLLPSAPSAVAAEPTWFQPGATWTGDFGDPTVVRVGDTYYAYASPVGGRVLPVLTSTDLVTWKVRARYSDDGPPGSRGYSVAKDPKIPDEIKAAPMGDWGKYDTNDALVRQASWGVVHPQGDWVQRDYWAPGVFSIGSTWFAYSPVRVSANRFCLTVASSSSPAGPFRDISGNGPVQCEDANVDPGGSIDPMPYHDGASGRNYLLWKSSGKLDDHASSLKAVQLGDNGFPLPGAPTVKLLETQPNSWEGDTIENPSMVSFGGTTYLFYSGNLSDPLDDQGHSNYASGYAVCPQGPLAACHRVQATPLVASAGDQQGPGGSAAFVDANGGLRMAYATFRLGENVGGAFPHPRRMTIAKLVRNGDGTLRVDGAPVVTSNDISTKWAAVGGAGGYLGAPTTAVLPTPSRPGYYQHFRGGSVYFSSATGSHVVRGLIRDRWAAIGWENSSLGFPATDEVALRGGAFNHFQGLIRDRWATTGWETGVLGYPVTDELPLRGGGAFNHFQGGSIYYSPAAGTHLVRGAIRDAWAGQGWETGRLGYPTSDEYAVADGRRSDFQGGSITWTPARGAVISFR